MQPYLFPYIGYFQLINAVDAFVVYDDVNYMKGGWINRNRILANKEEHLFTLQVRGASPNKRINEVSTGGNKEKLLTTIRQSYAQSKCFESVFPLIESVFRNPEENLSKFLDNGLRNACDFLNVRPTWFVSSQISKDESLTGQDRVLAICKELRATHYINPIGGRSLYSKKVFEREGISLSFIEQKASRYNQNYADWVPNLSIIDVLMFNDPAECSQLLSEYELIEGAG